VSAVRQTFNLPDAGEGLTEAEILTWHVAPGDEVTVNQVIVEIETAKAAVELPSPFAGTVTELLVGPGDTVAVGTPIIVIDSGVAGAGGPAGGDGAGAGGAGAGGAGAGAGAGGAAAGAGGHGEGGAKIGEVTADGRIATLVGYVAAPGSATRRARRSPLTAAPDARQDAASAPPTGPPTTSTPSGPLTASGPPATPHDRQNWRISSAERGQSSSSGDHGAKGATGAATGAAGQRSAGQSRGPVPLAKPPVRKLAKDLGVDLRELAGSGPLGDITRDDVRAWAQQPRTGNGHGTAAATITQGAADLAAVGGMRREPIRSLRKATAAAVVSSAFTAPHVTEFLTVDVTAMIELRDRLRASRDWAGVKLSPLTFAAKAVCLAARRTPEVNAHWDEEAQEIVFYDRVQLGIAAATPRGLMVPKIRDADLLSLRELAGALTELTEKARAGTTTPKELVGGTFTITNVGVFGVDTGTPILNPGESAILALGAVKQAPWVVDGELAVRTVCHLALSFDHRLVDGEQGSRFLADVGALLSDPALAMTF